MFKDKETSYIIEFLNSLYKYKLSNMSNQFYIEAYEELKKRQPKMAKLYEYRMMFDVGEENE